MRIVSDTTARFDSPFVPVEKEQPGKQAPDDGEKQQDDDDLHGGGWRGNGPRSRILRPARQGGL